MDNALPLISVIIPVYNVEKYLKRCMDSVLNQTYTNLEIVLVDDGSTDQSGKLCDSYEQIDFRIKVIHKRNGGVSDARNVGVENTKGQYITFIDPDDEVEWDYIEYLYHLICKYNCQIASCAAQVIVEANGNIYKQEADADEILSAHDGLKNILYQKNIGVSVWGKLYAKFFFEEGICYPVGKLAEDTGTTYKFLLSTSFIACGYRCKYKYHIRNYSITTSAFTSQYFDFVEMADNMAHDVCKKFPDLKNAALNFQMQGRFSTLNRLLRDNGKYQKEKIKIIKFITDNGIKLLMDVNVPKRTKLGILLLKMNLRLYSMCWGFYRWLKKA